MEEFKEAFIEKYFPRERREVNVEEIINLNQGNMSVEEYTLKFYMFSKYALSLVSNPRDKINRFVTGVTHIMMKEFHTAIIYDDLTLARLIMCAESIEESKIKRMCRNMKRGGLSNQDQPRFKNRAQTLKEPRIDKVIFEIVGGSQNEKPTCVTYAKRQYGKCLAGTSGCFGCVKDDHKVRDYPTIAPRRREAK